MGDSFYPVDILILAMVAAFLVFRLRSVLGRRSGDERRRPNPYAAPPPDAMKRGATVVPLPVRPPAARSEPRSLADRLADIHGADPSFDEKSFLDGARGAFRLIVGAFAAGDTQTLRPLLSDEVYGNFARAIAERRQQTQAAETRIDRIDDADIVDADLHGRDAVITVRFVSQQSEGPAEAGARPHEVIDLWSFARDTRSRDPNWTLIETRVAQ